MSPIPLELVTLIGSSVIGSITRLWGASLGIKRLQHMMTLQSLSVKAGIVHEARKYNNLGFQWTRRIIALSAVFFVIIFPKIVAVFLPTLPVHIGYPETVKGFFFLTADATKIHWIQLRGLVITPLDTHLLSAIVGLYFGGALIGNNN